VENLLKRNKIGQIVSVECPYSECQDNKPRCYDCAFMSQVDVRKIFEKLYRYEQTGLIFKE